MATESLSSMMSKRYGSKEKESASEDKAEGGESGEGAKLGARLASAIKSGDGELIYNAYAALHAHCNSEEGSK